MEKCRLKRNQVDSCKVWHHFLCLPCSWPHWCGRGSHPARHTFLCCSSLCLRQPAQGGRGQPAGPPCDQQNRYQQQTDKQTHKHFMIQCSIHSQAPSLCGWPGGRTSCHWSRWRSCLGRWPRNTDPESRHNSTQHNTLLLLGWNN